MGLIKVGTKLGVKATGRTGKLAKNNQVVKKQQTKEYKVHAQGVVQTGKKTVGFSIQSQPGKRAEFSFGYMNKGMSGVKKGEPYFNKVKELPLPTGKELAVAGGLIGTAYGVGHYESKKKQGKRTK
jgi:hypothetical protein